ncbi:MAG: hypothetical protein AAFR74_05285 [Pseudomonadota bacterium]
MRYDVFLVNALKDQEQAEMLVRRLKALKFKVKHDKKREHTTPTPTDYRNADKSQSIIVLWSEASCDTSDKDSDWVHALAHHARSKEGVLVQVGLDDTVPDDPFSHDKRYMLEGLTSRKTVEAYYDLVDDLGAKDGRKDLREWIDFKTSDKASKDSWKKAHPTDPLALVGKPVPKKAAAPVAAAATAAVVSGAASMAATTTPATAPAGASAAATLTADDEDSGIGWWMIAGILLGILAMLFFGWLLRKQAGTPAVGNAVVMAPQCPAGQMPAYLLDNTLEAAPVTDDTVE